MEIFIYTLTDPRDNMVKYVGKTNNIEKRFKEHIYESKNHKIKTKKKNWIRKLCNLNLLPLIDIIKVCNYDNYQYWEEFYIKKYKKNGCNLHNFDDKGVGSSGKLNKNLIKSVNSKKKPVIQYDIMGNEINRFTSIRQASRNTGINHWNIKRVCDKEWNHCNEFIFRYEFDLSPKAIINPNGKKKCVVKFIDGKNVEEYSSISEAARLNNLDSSTISRCCSGKLYKNKLIKFKFKI